MMTPEEHRLMILVLTKQQQIIKTMLDILKSRGLLQGDDARAFEFAARFDSESNAALLSQMGNYYVGVAKSLGIEVGKGNTEQFS